MNPLQHNKEDLNNDPVNRRMKTNDVIPVKKEFTFLFKITAVMVVSAAAALAILYLFLDKDVGTSYRSAFQTLSETYNQMNRYIIIAVMVQLVFSSILVYFVSLYFSHKIAGPMYRLKMVLQQYVSGEDITKVSFRQADFIPGVSKRFTTFLNFMANRMALKEEAQKLAQQLKETPEPERQKMVARLQSIIDEWEA